MATGEAAASRKGARPGAPFPSASLLRLPASPNPPDLLLGPRPGGFEQSRERPGRTHDRLQQVEPLGPPRLVAVEPPGHLRPLLAGHRYEWETPRCAKVLRNLEVEGMPSWPDQLQAISAAVGVLVTIGGFLFVSHQIQQVSQASRANAHAAIFSHFLELTRIMFENSEVRPYLAEGKELSKTDPLYDKVILACEMFGDFYEHVSLQQENLPEQSIECWDKAMALRYQKSSALRNYLDRHRSVYASDLFTSIGRGKELLDLEKNEAEPSSRANSSAS